MVSAVIKKQIKLLLHASDVLESSSDAVVLVRSPSGDIDIHVS